MEENPSFEDDIWICQDNIDLKPSIIGASRNKLAQ